MSDPKLMDFINKARSYHPDYLRRPMTCGCGWLMPEGAGDRMQADLDAGRITLETIINLADYGGVFVPCSKHAKDSE